MAYLNYAPFEAYRNGAVEFSTKQIIARFTEADRSRISGWFVLGVIGIAISMFFIHQVISFNQSWVVPITVFGTLIGYFIMNHKLTSYELIGDVTFTGEGIKLFNKKDQSTTLVNYSEIAQINGRPGVPYQIFKGKGQTEEYQSLQVVILLQNGDEVKFEPMTELFMIKNRKDVLVDYLPHLENLLKDIDPGYQIVDKLSHRFGKGWK